MMVTVAVGRLYSDDDSYGVHDVAGSYTEMTVIEAIVVI